MYRNAVEYPKGSRCWLSPGSQCMELYLEWRKYPNARGTMQNPTAKQKLDALCNKLDREFLKRGG